MSATQGIRTEGPSTVQALRAGVVMVSGSLALYGLGLTGLTMVALDVARGERPAMWSIAGSVMLVVYLAVRPRLLMWGATANERHAQLPGDDIAPGLPICSTRAITIDRPVEEVWPWIAQIGQDRGGFYSYEWLENLAGCRMVNADRIHPEWQSREVGEEVMTHWALGMPVARFEPNQLLALKGWGSWVLQPHGDEQTRLLLRGHRKQGLARAWDTLLIEFPHFLMERRMLLGIKQRAERARS